LPTVSLWFPPGWQTLSAGTGAAARRNCHEGPPERPDRRSYRPGTQVHRRNADASSLPADGQSARETCSDSVFSVLALLAGKRLNFGYFLILVLSVTFFHILSPWGRVLLEIGPLTITAGALEGGLTRSFTLVGMVFLSVAAVRPELELPGRLGGLLGRTFYYFDLIIEGKSRLSRKNFLVSLDNLLMERFDPNREDLTLGSAPVPAKTSGGWPAAIPVVMIPWGTWLWILIAGS